MESIRELYRIGLGPSSSHTMGPRRAADAFLKRCPNADHYTITLFGSLAATGRGHLTDQGLYACFGDRKMEIIWKPEEFLSFHPNGMLFCGYDAENQVMDRWEVFSVGGGQIRQAGEVYETRQVYPKTTLTEIMQVCAKNGWEFWEYVENYEAPDFWEFLSDVWNVMKTAINNGLNNRHVLPGELHLRRNAAQFYRKTALLDEGFRRTGLLSAYAHAVSEENASGGEIVTAPTCGACGVLPAVLRYVQEITSCSDVEIYQALATAGLIGNLIKSNASISGAEVGCQGEVGSACSMAAAAATQLLGGTIRQIEYAAEMGMEHHLGLTCDPICGLVQIPCIERNAHAANRALICADYAILGDGIHRISFDTVISVMMQTGCDLPSLYRETSFGGLAKAYEKPTK